MIVVWSGRGESGKSAIFYFRGLTLAALLRTPTTPTVPAYDWRTPTTPTVPAYDWQKEQMQNDIHSIKQTLDRAKMGVNY